MIEDLLNELSLNINDFNKNSNGDLEFNLESADRFGRIYSKLDRSSLVVENPDLSALTTDRSTIVFEGDDIQVSLQGDFDTDEYNLVIYTEE